MKKLLTLTVLLGVTAASFGQGVVNWVNTSSTLILLDPDGAGAQPSVNLPVKTGASTSYDFGLFLAPAGTAAPSGINDPAWTLVTAYTGNSTAAAGAGRMFNGGTASSATYLPGTSVAFIVRGWQTSVPGSTWDAAKALGFTALGTSSLGSLIMGGGAFPIPSTFGVAAGQIGGFTLIGSGVVPEPSSMALAGLGAASMLLFRRRK